MIEYSDHCFTKSAFVCIYLAFNRSGFY